MLVYDPNQIISCLPPHRCEATHGFVVIIFFPITPSISLKIIVSKSVCKMIPKWINEI